MLINRTAKRLLTLSSYLHLKVAQICTLLIIGLFLLTLLVRHYVIELNIGCTSTTATTSTTTTTSSKLTSSLV